MGASGTTAKGEAGLTERQRKWFASVRASLESKTGRPLEAWVEIMRACPEATNRRRLAWLKAEHGVGVNHGSFILSEAFPSADPGWDDPDALRAALWEDAGSEATLRALEAAAGRLDGVVVGQRKGYTAFSRTVQFAAARPLKGGRALLGLKLEPEVSERLSAPTRRESWSERLTAVLELSSPDEVDAEVERLLALAYERG